MATANQKPITGIRHPEYAVMLPLWERWRLSYEGGRQFIERFLKRYSRRESTREFDDRKEISYNPGHLTTIINIVRNALTAKLPEVTRKGSAVYLDLVQRDVDLKNQSLASFISQEILPLLLVQAKRFVMVDAPVQVPGTTTRAQESGRPFMWAVGAEQLLSWHYDEETGWLDTALIAESIDTQDPETHLVSGVAMQYRYLRLLRPGERYGSLTGPGVLVRIIGADGKDKITPKLMQGLNRLPLVEFRLADSLVKNLADIQIALLNLASTDMTFLFRGNFPIFVKEVSTKLRMIKPAGTKRSLPISEEIDIEDRTESASRRANEIPMGNTQGVGYEEGTNQPGFIAPPTNNVEISMKKQDSLGNLMRSLADLALVNLSISAVEQSGKSKEADRVGKEEGLLHVGNALETGERELLDVMHQFLGDSTTEQSVRYPSAYTVKTQGERNEEANSLAELKNKVRNELFQKSIDKRVAEVLLRSIESPERITEIQTAIDESPWFDDNESRGKQILSDVGSQLLTAELASVLRGYPADQSKKAEDAAFASAKAQADFLSGGG